VYVEDYIHVFAGAMVLASLALGYFWTPWWFLLTAFVGLNLFHSTAGARSAPSGSF